jgi:hypothetical protein
MAQPRMIKLATRIMLDLGRAPVFGRHPAKIRIPL